MCLISRAPEEPVDRSFVVTAKTYRGVEQAREPLGFADRNQLRVTALVGASEQSLVRLDEGDAESGTERVDADEVVNRDILQVRIAPLSRHRVRLHEDRSLVSLLNGDHAHEVSGGHIRRNDLVVL